MGGVITLSISQVKVLRKEPVFAIPESEKRRIYTEIESIIGPMIEAGTATGVDVESAYAKEALATYASGVKGLNVGSNVCCHGSKVQVTSFRTYYLEEKAAHSPEDFYNQHGRYPFIYATKGGSTVVVHTMRGPQKHGLGRAGGATGWDKLRDAFAFALASFKHNFECLMGVFSSRPELPCSDEWKLPNLVYDKDIVAREKKYNATIVEPPVAVPPASYKYNFAFPTPLVTLGIGTKCPKDTETYVEVWDEDKKDMTEPTKVTFPEGESETIVNMQSNSLLPSIKSGFVNINPVNSEMTISYVNVYFPPL